MATRATSPPTSTAESVVCEKWVVVPAIVRPSSPTVSASPPSTAAPEPSVIIGTRMGAPRARPNVRGAKVIVTAADNSRPSGRRSYTEPTGRPLANAAGQSASGRRMISTWVSSESAPAGMSTLRPPSSLSIRPPTAATTSVPEGSVVVVVAAVVVGAEVVVGAAVVVGAVVVGAAAVVGALVPPPAAAVVLGAAVVAGVTGPVDCPGTQSLVDAQPLTGAEHVAARRFAGDSRADGRQRIRRDHRRITVGAEHDAPVRRRPSRDARSGPRFRSWWRSPHP